jgi:hypothetical protein
MNLASRDVRHLVIKQRSKRAQDPALRLSAQAEENEIVSRQDGIDDLRHHGVVVADDSRKNGAALSQFARQVVAHLVFHVPFQQSVFGEGTLAQLTERARKTHDGKPPQQNSLLALIIRPLV